MSAISPPSPYAHCDRDHAGAEYVLTGPESLTQFDQLRIIGQVIGRDFPIEEISPDAASRELAARFSPAVANMLLNAWGAAADLPAFISSTFQEVTGSPARTFRDWATAHARHFQP